ncbi:MAG: phosphoglucosamine mutase [Planctomycetota bacterium]|nr:phosphoglucosamine mutase [Planctomycetota bacterium]
MTTIFGTDGIRGRAYEGWLGLEGMAAIGHAAGSVLAPQGGSALLGHDGRRSGPDLERAFAAGLLAAGVAPTSCGLTTTPGLAWLTRTGAHALGAMVSASHNPAEDNGIKLFSGIGGKLTDADQDAIEARLHAQPAHAPEHPELAVDPGMLDRYAEHLIASVGPGLSLKGLNLVLDCANGGGSQVGPLALERLGANVHALACAPDGMNINQGCGSTKPKALQASVLERGAHLGIALDGDGDRCILVDETGALVHGDHILMVIARWAVSRGQYPDPRVVATVMSNRGLHRALREAGVGVVEVPVGDRAVVEGLRRENLKLGGEQSGHIVFGDENAYIGDGMFTALRVLEVMVLSGETLSSLAAPYVPMPQILLNVPVLSKPELATLAEVMALTQSIEDELGDDGRVLLRYSGTEDLARVMVEGINQDHINGRARELADLIRDTLGAPA